MTEVAADANVPDIPPLPRRAGRGGSGSGGFGATLIALVATGLLLTAGGLAWRPARFSGALQALADENPAAQEAARKTLLDMKDYAATRLGAVAMSPAAPQRLRAMRGIRILGLKDDRALGELVRKAAADEKEDPAVRSEAVSCLGQFANDGSKDALSALLDLAEKPSVTLREDLSGALGEMQLPGEEGKLLLVERALKALGPTPHSDPRIRGAYLKALRNHLTGWLGTPEAAPSEQALKTLQAAVWRAADEEAGIRLEADALLRQIQEPKRIALALDCLPHEDPWIRVWAEATLSDLSGRCAGFDPFGPEGERKAAAEKWRALVKTGP